MIVIGLTGGTGSGKSTVASICSEYGAHIIDADKVARDIVKKGTQALNEIVDFFGDNVLLLNGELDRKKLGRIVFEDKGKLRMLNKITHKYITEVIEKEIDIVKTKNTAKAIIIDAAILIESGIFKRCDKVWVVVADKKIRLERIMNRENISKQDVINRINSQLSDKEMVKYATDVIENNTGMNKLRDTVVSLFLSINE